MKKTLKKVWWFVWESDSIWSWIVNVILAFLLIYFIVYPGLGFFLQTTHPIVAVVSESMEHDSSFDDWWASKALCESNIQCTQAQHYAQLGITKEQFKTFSFKNGFNKGDIMVLKGVPPENIKLGDTIVFQSIRPDPIIHRVVEIDQEDGIYFYQTKGDHNTRSISGLTLEESDINQNKVIGYEKYQKTSKAVMKVPFLGWIKIGFVLHPILFILGFIIFITIISNYEEIKKRFK